MSDARHLFERWLEAHTLEGRDLAPRDLTDDPAVRVELEGLIESFKAIDDALPSPTRTGVPDLGGLTPREPPELSRFDVGELLGEGGMGEVWAAEQRSPIRRPVALKVIKRGLDTAQVMHRFDAERQSLAAMDHPAIAKVFEAGATDDGRPYFVMERVAGTAITVCCDRLGLSVERRLELFVEVCRGVHHAHQKGVIHRDLKPSNVLLKEDGDRLQPTIIDFGIAKAVTADAAHVTVTELGQVVGTPAYMSPEQADFGQQDVDTRSDVYSLGVLLFELLVGVRPFDDRALPFDRETEATPTPSSRLSSLGARAEDVATRRSARLQSLARTLRGELDWIVLKALEADREKRYSSPADLAEDIERYFRNEPVEAGPPGTGYHVKKFIRRHRLSVGLGVIVLLAIGSALTGLAVGLERALEAEERARAEATLAQGVADFLAELFERASPTAELGAELSVRELLDEGAERIGKELEDQPLVRSRLLVTMGRAYHGLGRYDESTALLEDAVETLEADPAGAGDSLELADALHELAEVQTRVGDFEAVEANAGRAMAIRRARLDPRSLEVARSHTQLGNLRWRTGRYVEALGHHEAALEIQEEVLGPEDGVLAKPLNNVAILRLEQGDFAGARELMERGLELFERDLGPDHPNVASNYNNLGIVANRENDFPACVDYLRKSLEIRRAILEPDHPDIAEGLNNLGTCLHSLGDYDEAIAVFEEAIEIRRRVLGDSHSDLASSLANLGRGVAARGDLEGGRTLIQGAHDMFVAELGPEHPYLAFTFAWLGHIDALAGNLEAAHRDLTQCRELRRRTLGPLHPLLLNCITPHFEVLEALGLDAEYQELEALRADIHAEHPGFADAESPS
ncbi:MAG: serine/threonine-protein kinase [Acidobacteriota bacterium]